VPDSTNRLSVYGVSARPSLQFSILSVVLVTMQFLPCYAIDNNTSSALSPATVPAVLASGATTSNRAELVDRKPTTTKQS